MGENTGGLVLAGEEVGRKCHSGTTTVYRARMRRVCVFVCVVKSTLHPYSSSHGTAILEFTEPRPISKPLWSEVRAVYRWLPARGTMCLSEWCFFVFRN